VEPDSGHKQELKQRDKLHKERIDSLNTLYIGVMKSLTKARIEKEQAILDANKAIEERKKATRRAQIEHQKYESIKFERIANDSIRWRILSELYPSIDSLR